MAAADIVRIAVTSTIPPLDGTPRPQNYLMQLSKSTSLSQVVRDLCKYWGIDGDSEEFGLKFDNSDEYVTETSKKNIKDGTILKLCVSAKCTAKDIVEKLKSDDDAECLKGCNSLKSASTDFVVVENFINFGGLAILTDYLTGVRTLKSVSAQSLCVAAMLGSLNEIMKHEDTPLSWDDERFCDVFVSQICKNIGHSEKQFDRRLSLELQKQSLIVLDNLCQSSKRHSVQNAVSIRGLLSLLTVSDDIQVQRVILSLYNAIFSASGREKKQSMRRHVEELNIRNVILTKILIKDQLDEMRRQLFIFQCLLFDDAASQMMIPVENQDPKALEKIKELRLLAFNPEMSRSASVTHRGRYSEDYKSLGFVSTLDPTQDFRSTPPGILALDLMFNFAKNQTDLFSKLTIENVYRGMDSSNACPFAASSISLTKLIINALHIGQDVPSKEIDLQPMIFSQESPLDAIFAIMIQHLFKTWREMRATAEDFDKVMEVAKEQLTSGLKGIPASFEDLKKNLKSYNQVSDIWKEAAKSRSEQESKAVEELRQILLPEMINLVQRQRLNFTVEGTKFAKQRREGGSRHVFVKLSPNHKTIYFGDWNDSENSPPTIDNLPNKIAVADIKDFRTGADSTSQLSAGRDVRRHRGADPSSQYAMSIVTDGLSLDVLAAEQKTFDYWCDALNALMRRDMVSNRAVDDIELFLSMEVKIRLLDVEGIELPKVAPMIPPPPPPIGACRHRQ